MPIEIKDLHGGLGNIIKAWGILTESEFIDALKEHLTQDKDKIKKYRYSLCDLTAVSKVEISTKAIELLADYCISAAINNPRVVVATVANKDLIFGLSRMAEMLRVGTSWEENIFRDRQDAEAWIKERVKEKYGIDDLTFHQS